MNAPGIGSAALVTAIRPLLLQTITVQQNTALLTPPGGGQSWSALHSDIAASVQPATTDERRAPEHVLGLDTYTVVADGWLSDVTSAMRVVYGGQDYDILGVSRLGDLNLTRIVIQRRAS